MTLQDMLEKTKMLDEDVMVARFNNGLDVAYEKQPERRVVMRERSKERGCGRLREEEVLDSRTTVKYKLLSKGGLCNGHNCRDVETGEWGSFSRKAHRAIDQYNMNNPNMLADWDKRVNDVAAEFYQEITRPLGIKGYSYMDWKDYGDACNLAFGWPVHMIHYMIEGHKHDHSGDGGLVVTFAPLRIPNLVKELFDPKDFLRTSNKITNTEPLHRNNNGHRTAVDFGYGGEPKRFNRLELIFPNGISLSERGVIKHPNQEYVMGSYKNSEYYLDVEPKYAEAVTEAQESIDSVRKEWREFNEKLNNSDQMSFLRSQKFVEE